MHESTVTQFLLAGTTRTHSYLSLTKTIWPPWFMQITVMVALCGADFRAHTMMCLSSTGLVLEITGICGELVHIKWQTQICTDSTDWWKSHFWLFNCASMHKHTAVNPVSVLLCIWNNSQTERQEPYFLQKQWDSGTVSIRDLMEIVQNVGGW